MRPQFLQYLYLQKPITMVVLICAISILPWIGLSDFSTKGEPREAAVAISMLETDNWVLPTVYADEFAYKPPMAHWLIAAASYPQGSVSEFSSRLPSAIALLVLMGCTLMFFGERVKFQEAFISTLILLTCIEIHRAGMTSRVDMLLTTFVVLGLYTLYWWENKLQLKGLPIIIPLLLSCAVLTKGPVGVILPLFIFGVYLLVLNKYSVLTVAKSILYIGVASIFLPLIWYVAAWKQGGDDFLHVVLAENFGRFFAIDSPAINYELGHENGVWYNLVTLLAGFMPWTVFFFFSLFGLKLYKPTHSVKEMLTTAWTRIRSMEKVKLFGFVALVCIFVFYSIPSSKRSVYLMPAYPFISLFLAQYAIYLTEYRTKVTRVFAGVLAAVVSIVLIVVALIMAGVVDPVVIASRYSGSESTADLIESVSTLFASPDSITSVVLLIVVGGLISVLYQMSKKINLKILYATIGLTFAVNLLIDGAIMRNIHNNRSSRPFAEQILNDYPLNSANVFVMNNLKAYRNLYGLNFYMGNLFHNFEKEMPQTGYFLVSEEEMRQVITKYGDRYTFQTLTSTPKPVHEIRQHILLTRFTAQ